MRLLISAYACEPGRGSEPGVGWNLARELAKYHEVWVITRANNRAVIEAELHSKPVEELRFIYYDLPQWARWWKRGAQGTPLYYYMWQIGVYFVARQMHKQLAFDVSHHVTFQQYWTPSIISSLPVPFLWGPVGGGESAPSAFFRDLGPRGCSYEMLRNTARWAGEHDPLVRNTAQRSALALATTRETATRLRALGAPRVETLGQTALSLDDIDYLGSLTMGHDNNRPFTLVSIGRFLFWKGFHLGLRAFAHARLRNARYYLIGKGPAEASLRKLAAELGIEQQVTFLGELPRREALKILARAHALLHPSLHDSGGWVCLEAMAAHKPVLCLELGGPAMMVDSDTGVVIPAQTPKQVVSDMAKAIRRLAQDPDARATMGSAGAARVKQELSWYAKAKRFNDLYLRVLDTASQT